MGDIKFSICMPAYQGAAFIKETIDSILSQSFTNFELIIVDDNSKDNTEEVVRMIGDRRIRFFKNEKNLGYPKNMEVCRSKAEGDILYLMGQDDILAKDALLNTYKAFKLSDDIGAVTRPYYWFDEDIRKPVRAKDQFDSGKDSVISIKDGGRAAIEVFKTLDQLSGLALRTKFMDTPFHEDVFPCHIYPFAAVFKRHPIVFLKDYNVAVRIKSSQCRSVSSIYEKSPMQSWVEMFENVFQEKEFEDLRKRCIKDFVAVNYVGLVQIRNYAKYRYLLREILLLVKYRWQNLYNPAFWFFSAGTAVIPPALLIPLVDYYKSSVNSRFLKDIKFEYDLKRNPSFGYGGIKG